MAQSIINCIIAISCCLIFSCSKKETVSPNYVSPTYNLPAPVVGKTYSADEIIAFKQMSFTYTNVIKKLPTHVSLYLVDTTFPYLTHELDLIINKINKILDTTLVLKRTNDLAASTIQVYLTDRDTYLQKEPSAASALQPSNYTGFAYINWSSDGLIYHGSAFVDMSRTIGDTVQQRHLIHHEIMHTLGLIGHVSLPQFYSVLFYNTLTPLILDYTDFGVRMMLLLYNPSVKPGMTESEFNEVVKNI